MGVKVKVSWWLGVKIEPDLTQVMVDQQLEIIRESCLRTSGRVLIQPGCNLELPVIRLGRTSNSG